MLCFYFLFHLSALIFIISFFLLILGLLCFSFSSSLRYNVKLFIWDLSFFLDVYIYNYKLFFKKKQRFFCIPQVIVGCVPSWAECRICSMACAAHWLGIQIRQNCQLSPLATWSHKLCFTDGKSCWLGSLLRCHCKRKHSLPRSEHWLLKALAPSFLFVWYPVVVFHRFFQWFP